MSFEGPCCRLTLITVETDALRFVLLFLYSPKIICSMVGGCGLMWVELEISYGLRPFLFLCVEEIFFAVVFCCNIFCNLVDQFFCVRIMVIVFSLRVVFDSGISELPMLIVWDTAQLFHIVDIDFDKVSAL